MVIVMVMTMVMGTTCNKFIDGDFLEAFPFDQFCHRHNRCRDEDGDGDGDGDGKLQWKSYLRNGS